MSLRITLISNVLSPHQMPFSKAMYELIGEKYRFVSCTQLSDERRAMGWAEQPGDSFELKAYQSPQLMEKATKLATDSDVVILGSASDDFIKERLKMGKLTFKYSERLYKQGLSVRNFPRAAVSSYIHHGKYQKYPLYMLCASAYTAADVAVFGNYSGRTYKWGYFPETKIHNISLFLRKDNKRVKVLWVGRLIDLKKTRDAIDVAQRLTKAGYDFQLDIIGTGPCENHLQEQVVKSCLTDKVHLLGPMSPGRVRNYMEHANIFLFTSDFNEGWGAVLNESMNSGCAVVASHAIGSVPFLIRDGYNGLIYQYGNKDMFYEKVRYLFDYPSRRDEMGQKAYETIVNSWNAEAAAERFIKLCNKILSGDRSPDLYEDGPCSRADIIKNNWFKEGE